MHTTNPACSIEAKLRELEAAALELSRFQLSQALLQTEKIYVERLDSLENAHSRSWFGDHSNTYYENLKPPPAGRSFDVEWGFIPGYQGSRNRGWRVFSREELQAFVFEDIGQEIFYELAKASDYVSKQFSILRDQSLDVLDAAASGQNNSKAFTRYVKKLEDELTTYDVAAFISARIAAIPRMSRDSEEIAKGTVVPAHVQYLAPVKSIETNKQLAEELATTLRNAIQALALRRPTIENPDKSKVVFLGHGRSEQWKVLADFLSNRLNLQFEEFNRVSSAGVSTQERLSEMLDRCGFAFLIMTTEDQQKDGSHHARENVVHEVGLFQGQMGWRKAIILLEEGCTEFSNIVGLGQIRFSRGNVATAFEEVRKVLEREGILK